jgi:nucleotide-binding universal stress UspA family protein
VPHSGNAPQSGSLIKSIVLATDFLESSRLALDYAVAFAHHYSAKLTIVHAVQLPPEAEEAEMLRRLPSISREHATARLEAFASGVRRLGVDTAIDLRAGDPYAAVLGSTIENKADLLVLGTHGVYRGLEHMLIGSNAEKILMSSPCPTLAVGRHVMAGIDLKLNFRQILMVADMTQESVAAAQYADSLGKNLGVPAELIQLLADDEAKDSDYERTAIEKYCASLRCLPGFSGHEWTEPAYHLKRISTPDEITNRAIGCADGLLILGVRKEPSWKRHLHASFAFKLIAKSGCPVLSLHIA